MKRTAKVMFVVLLAGAVGVAFAEAPRVLEADAPHSGTLRTPQDCAGLTTMEQPFDDEWFGSAANADLNGGYIVADDNQVGGLREPFADGVFQTIRVWGIEAINAGGWAPCTDAGDEFTVFGYADNSGVPGTEIVSVGDLVAVQVDTGILFAGVYPVYEYTITVPGMPSNGVTWIGVQREDDLADTCWFLWVNNTSGLYNNVAAQFDGAIWTARPDEDTSICIGWDVPVELQSFSVE